MPTIQQLPPASSVDPADEIPISQSGTTRSVIVGDLLASTQPAISAPTGSLLGRNSVGSGSPEAVNIGSGLVLSGGTLSAVGGGSLSIAPQVATIATTDLVYISQGGQSYTISYADLIDGQTIDAAQPAAAGSDTDTFWVAQGSSTMVRQTFAAVWNWLGTKLPMYKLPVIELTTNLTLDGTVHNGRVLVCSQPVTLTPLFTNMGSGFECDIINLSAGNVTLGPGIVTSSGATALPPGLSASLRGLTYSGGDVVYASMSGAGGGSGAAAAPGQVTGLATGSITATTIELSWSPPSSGGVPSSYSIQFRVSGTGTWNTSSSSVGSTAFTVSGLTASTSYDFQVFAVNAGGNGAPSSIVSANTSASSSLVTSITWNAAASGNYTAGSGTIGVNAQVSPAAAAVQFGFSTSATVPPTSWAAATNVNTNLWGAYVPTPATAGTWYSWCEGTDGSAPTVYPTSFTVSDAGGSGAAAAPGQVTGLAAGSITATTIELSWSAPSSGGVPSSYSVQFRVSGTGTWDTSSSSVGSTAYTVSGLTASTSYDFQVFAANEGGSGAPSSIISASTSASSSSVASITWNVAASGNYTAGSGTIGVNVEVSPAAAAVQFGFSTSTTAPPTSWTAAAHVNTNLWGAYVPTPASAGTWYNWCEGTDGSAPTVYPTSFTVS